LKKLNTKIYMPLFTTMKPNNHMHEKRVTSLQTCETFAADEVITVTTIQHEVAFQNTSSLSKPLVDYNFVAVNSNTCIGSTSSNTLEFNTMNFTVNHSRTITTMSSSFNALPATLHQGRQQKNPPHIHECEKLRGNDQEKRTANTDMENTSIKSALKRAGELGREGLSVRWATSVPALAPGDCPPATPINEQIRKSLHNSGFQYDVKKEIWVHDQTQTVVKTENYGGEVLNVEANGICSSLVETFLSSTDWKPILFGRNLLDWLDAQVLSSTYLTKEMVSTCCDDDFDGSNGSNDTDSSASYSDTDSSSDSDSCSYSYTESEYNFEQGGYNMMAKEDTTLSADKLPWNLGCQNDDENRQSESSEAGVCEPVLIIWESA